MKQKTNPARPVPIFKPRESGRGAPNEDPLGKLIIIYGNHAGREYPLGAGRILIGRMDQCDILINDSSVSRRQASIERKDGRFLLRDLKSANGTMVNGRFIGVHILIHGDKIRIGRTVLQFLGREITLTVN